MIMPTVEERLCYLENQMAEHEKIWEELKLMVIHFGERVIDIEKNFQHPIIETNQRIDRLFTVIFVTMASSIGSFITAIASMVVILTFGR